MDLTIREQVLEAFKLSKSLEEKGNLCEALTVVEKISAQAFNPHFSLSWKIMVRIGNICHQIGRDPIYMRKAEQYLGAWITQIRKDKLPMNEFVLQTFVVALNDWAVFHQEENNYHIALSYLMRAVKLLDNYPSSDSETLGIFAKTRHNLSALYIELRRFKEAIHQGELALIYLQKENKNTVKDEGKVLDMVCTYVSVLYNIGFSEGALGNTDKMKEAYSKALEISSNSLPESHPLLLKIKDAGVAVSKRRQVENPLKKSNNPKVPGRYYTKDQLDTLQQRIADTGKTKFVSADQFFYHKIKKLLKLDKDTKVLKDGGLTLIAEAEQEDKKHINNLRLRRHCRKVNIDQRGLDYVQHRIDLLLREDAGLEERNKILLKAYKQKLKRAENSDKDLLRSKTLKNFNNYQIVKDEIEGLMDNISQELFAIDNRRKVKRRQKNTCTLAKSAWQYLSTPQFKQHVIEASVLSAFKSKVY